MLNLLLLGFKEGLEIHQVFLEAGEKLNRILRGCCPDFEQCWLSEDRQEMLGLYFRPGREVMNEAGVYYGPGPSFEDQKNFPDELLRLFSLDGKCLDITRWYFADLVQEYNFHEIDIAKKARHL